MKVLNYTGLQNFWTNIKNYITVHTPTKTSDLTNDSNFVDTSNSAVSSGITSAKVTSYDTHITDTDKHVTTADKNKWNAGITQAYVVRYASVAVSDNSTVPYSNLNNTDNIKANDLLLDINGKIYQISAVDTSNETVSVTTPLTQLAVDSDVLHKTGNETKSGELTLENDLILKGSTTPVIVTKSKIDLDTTGGNENISWIIKDKTENYNVFEQRLGKLSTQIVDYRLNITARYNNNSYTRGVYLRVDPVNQIASFNPSGNNLLSLGVSTAKYSNVYTNKINDLEPSSLSLPVFPSASSFIDISGAIVDMTGAMANNYTPPANGYVTFVATGSQVQIFSDYGLQSKFSIQSGSTIRGYHPVLKNEAIKIYMVGTGIEFFRFIPCQGNV